MTEPELRALEELEARATKGPWIINGPDNSDCGPPVYWLSPNNDDSNEATIATFDTGEHDNEANAKYLGQLRNAAPELIASARRVVKLEAEREAMQLEIDQGREAREMTNDSIDALQSRLAAAEAENADFKQHMYDYVAEGVEEAKSDAEHFDKDLWKAIRAWLEKRPGFNWQDYDDGIDVGQIIDFLSEEASETEAMLSALRASVVALQSRLSAAEAENARLLADNIRAHEALAPALRRLNAADDEKSNPNG